MMLLEKQWRIVIVTFLTIVAGWLRFSAINFGLPDQFRPDEELLVPAAMGLPIDRTRAAVYPDGQRLVVRAALAANATLRREGRDLANAYRNDNDGKATLIARLTTAAMGTATVPIIYLAAAPVYGAVAGIASAGTLAVSFIHARESKFAKTEVPAGLWVALSILAMLRMVQRGRFIDYVVAGVACGLAAATHYASAVIAIGIAVAHVERSLRTGRSIWGLVFDRRLWIAGIATIATFVAADPAFRTDPRGVLHTLGDMRADYRWWNGGESPGGFGWRWLLGVGMPRAFGIELQIFFLLALCATAVHRKPGTPALAVFVLFCFWGLLGGHPQLETRYLIDPLLALVLLGGVLASDVVIPVLIKSGRAASWTIGMCGAAFLLGPSVVRDIQMNHLLRQTDTRSIARQWMFAHIPEGTAVGIVNGNGYGKPPLYGHYPLVPVKFPLTNAVRANLPQWFVVDTMPNLELWSKPLSSADLSELNAKARLELDVDPVRAEVAAPIFDPNDAFYVPVFHIGNMIRPGPRIRVWQTEPPRSE